MQPAAGEAGDPPPGSPDAFVSFTASRTTESIASSHAATPEGKLMGAGLVRNPKITAGHPPLGTVGIQSSSADTPVTVVGQKMSQLMEQGFLNLPFGDPLPFQGRIQPNLPL